MTLFLYARSLLALLDGLIGDGGCGLAGEDLGVDPWVLLGHAGGALLDWGLTLLKGVFALLFTVLVGAEAG